jgi:hypothetical protein
MIGRTEDRHHLLLRFFLWHWFDIHTSTIDLCGRKRITLV